jgi:hypothetical protein
MGPIIVREKLSVEDLQKLLEENFETMVKVEVDMKQKILAVGGEWHAFGQELLVNETGSDGQDVWGANVYPREQGDRRIEYVSLINIKPALGCKNMRVEDASVRDGMKDIIEKLIPWQ